MCKDCGCGVSNDEHHHSHTHDYTHKHSHDHGHDHGHNHNGLRTVTVEQKILIKNDEVAQENRRWLLERGIVALNMISSPGSGKTTLLERTLERLRGRVPVAVITGDQRTDNDAKRLSGKGAIVRQIETFSACHLDAAQVKDVLPEVARDGAKIIFIENVGNLVCPAAFDLGETFKVALLSTTEGEDKPEKYPALFSAAPVVVLTKMDLAVHLDWDLVKCRQYIRKTHPGVFIFELSARTGDGMDEWITYLERQIG